MLFATAYHERRGGVSLGGIIGALQPRRLPQLTACCGTGLAIMACCICACLSVLSRLFVGPGGSSPYFRSGGHAVHAGAA